VLTLALRGKICLGVTKKNFSPFGEFFNGLKGGI